MQLTRHFSLAEMTRSETASRRGIDNTPPAPARRALKRLCEEVLEPVRLHFGRPVIVTSGYRSPVLNAVIGGALRSQHTLGEAADFTVAGRSNIAVCCWIASNLAFDQLIYEFGEAGWIHVSWREAGRRMETLSARRVAGRTRYASGLLA